MKQQEYYALQALFNHLAEIDQDHTVISIQIENEPNSGKGGSEWAAQVQWMDYLGKAVKESRYVVATRFNFSGTGYPANVNDLPYIDFAGPDPYKRGVGDIKNIITSGETNSTIGYIAENSGNYANLSSLTTAAFTAGGFYGTWALDNWFCDGGGGHFNGPHSLYENISDDYSTRYYCWKLGTIPNLTPQATDIMHYNKGMNKMGRIIAAASKEEMQSFNVEGDNPGQIYDNMKKIGNYQLGYQADDASLAIAVISGQNIYMTSDTAGVVKVKIGQKPLKVSEGEIAGDGSWAENTVKEVKRDELGVYYVELNSEECIRLEMTEAEITEEDNLALSAIAESTNVSKNHPAGNVNDGDDSTGTKSNSKPTFPQYVTLKWDEGKTFDTVILKGCYSQDQSPTNWDIEVSEDGETDWQMVASSGDVNWETNDGLEAKSVGFTRQTGKKGLRIKITNANMTWNAYYITELQVFDAGGKLRTLVDSIDAALPVETDYMADLWNPFSEILLEARELLASEQITKSEATKLFVRLKQAQGDMINKNELGKMLELSKAEVEKTEVYTAESLAVLHAAIEAAQAVYNSPEVSKEEIVDITVKLDEAVAGLVKAVKVIEVTAPERTEYEQGQELNLAGLKVMAVYSDDSKEDVTGIANVAVENYDKDKVGEQKITVTYGGKTGEFTVTVKEKTSEEGTGNIQIAEKTDNAMGSTLPNAKEVEDAVQLDEEEKQAVNEGKVIKVALEVQEKSKEQTEPADVQAVESVLAGEVLNNQYTEGAYLDLSLYKTIEDDESTKKAVTETAKEVTIKLTLPENLRNTDPSIKRTYKVIRIHNGLASILDTVLDGVMLTFMTDRFSTYVLAYNDSAADQPTPPAITGLNVTPPVKTEYIVGEELDTTGLVVTAVYSDGTTSDVTGEAVLTGYNKEQTGEQTVTVSYKEASADFQVMVKENGDKPNPEDKPNPDDKPNSDDKPNLDNKPNPDDKPGTDGNQNSGNSAGQNTGNNNQNSGSDSSQASGSKAVSSSPRTGDTQNIMLFVCMMTLAAGVVTVILAKRRKVR